MGCSSKQDPGLHPSVIPDMKVGPRKRSAAQLIAWRGPARPPLPTTGSGGNLVLKTSPGVSEGTAQCVRIHGWVLLLVPPLGVGRWWAEPGELTGL